MVRKMNLSLLQWTVVGIHQDALFRASTLINFWEHWLLTVHRSISPWEFPLAAGKDFIQSYTIFKGKFPIPATQSSEGLELPEEECFHWGIVGVPLNFTL